MTTENTTNADTEVKEVNKLSPEEVAQLTQLHRQAQEIVQQIGQIEVRKHRMMASLSEIEEHAQGIMNAAASRLGIAPGTAWQMAPDGTVIVLPKTPAAQTH
jgi:predicted NBD/HSP70 family sugar kinase